MLSLSLDANLVLKEWEHVGGSMFTPGNHAMDSSAWAVPNMDTFQLDMAGADAMHANLHDGEQGESSHNATCAAVPSLDPFSRSNAAHASSSGGGHSRPLDCHVPDLFTASSFDFGFADDFEDAAGDHSLRTDMFAKLPPLHSKAPQQQPRPPPAGVQSDDSAGVVPCMAFQPPLDHSMSYFPTHQQLQQEQQRQQNQEGSGSVDPPASPAAAACASTHDATPWYRSSVLNAWDSIDDAAVVPDAVSLGSLSSGCRGAQVPPPARSISAAAAAEAAAIAAAAALVPQAPSTAFDVPVVTKTSKRRAAVSAQLSRDELEAMMEAAKPSAHAFELPVASTRPKAPGGVGGGGGEPVEFYRSRAECLARYREKKARRSHAKKIRYHLRKVNADKRPRVKGRFVKKEDMAAYLASIGATAPEDDDTSPDSPVDQNPAAPSPAAKRRAAAAANASNRSSSRSGGSGSGGGRKSAAAASKKSTSSAAAAAAAASVVLPGGGGGGLLEMEQHDQLLYSMLQLHGNDMDMLVEGLEGLESDDELEQEAMEQLMLVPEMPM